MKSTSRPLTIALLVALSGASTPTFALPEDKNQPIKIQADRAERDDKLGVTIYAGDVEIDQGTLHLEADKVVIESEADEPTLIIATGSPAKLRQLPAPDKEVVHALANTIKYYLDKEQVILIDNASIRQQGSIVNSERIDYFIADGKVKAQGNAYSSSRKRRVEMVIPPKKTGKTTP
jgi:lipopolysaccharide export system protein LptA